jgi:hypothetical protein
MKTAFTCLALMLVSSVALAENTRVTNPNALSVELLGRGVLYSISYDRVMDDHLAAGFGVGAVPTSSETAMILPAYVNYYFFKEQGSLFATAGVGLVLNSSSVKNTESTVGSFAFPSNAVIPQFGVGYENRGDTGFLFRVTAYGLVGDEFMPWGGFSFGYAF